MKATIVLLALITAPLIARGESALEETPDGTWSGGWTSQEDDLRRSMTIELKEDENGVLTGRFLTPATTEFTAVTFDAETQMLLLAASDEAGVQYKLSVRVEGTEMDGDLTAGAESGTVHLIKWTYVPPIGRR